MLLNCDLGESDSQRAVGIDAKVMPHIDQASIACGFHAGDPLTMQNALNLAARYGVMIGAHPAYPDRAGFGRRSIPMNMTEIGSHFLYQIAALDGMARSMGLTMDYVKPHGALYHDMMEKGEIRATILQTIARFYRPLKLIMQATLNNDKNREEADTFGVKLLFEGFADRRYSDTGTLVDRRQPAAVLRHKEILQQVTQLRQRQSVTTVGGKVIPLQVDTVCVHGDNREGVHAIEAIRALMPSG